MGLDRSDHPMAEDALDFDGIAVDGGSSQCIAARHSNVPRFPPNNPLSPPELTRFSQPSKTQRKYDATRTKKDKTSEPALNTASDTNKKKFIQENVSGQHSNNYFYVAKEKRKMSENGPKTTIGQHTKPN